MEEQNTPVKDYGPTACVTCSYKCREMFKLNNEKCRAEGTLKKLYILTNTIVDSTKDLSICRPCLNTLNDFYVFRNTAIESIKLANAGKSIQKRRHEGPEAETQTSSVPLNTSANTLVVLHINASMIQKQAQKKIRISPPESSKNPVNMPRKEEQLFNAVLCIDPPNDMEEPELQDRIMNILHKRRFQWNPQYASTSLSNCKDDITLVKASLENKPVNPNEFAASVKRCGSLYDAMKREILADVDSSVSSLTKRCDSYSSVLLKYRKVQNLNSTENFLIELLQEMNDRCPFLLDVMMTTVNADYKVPTISTFGPLITAYAILMHCRDQQLSAFQRLMNLACVKDHATDDLISRFCKLGITLTPTSKRTVLDSCTNVFRSRVVSALKDQPMVKISGANLAVNIRTKHQASDQKRQKMHMFTSNIIFPRVPMDMLSDQEPHPDVDAILPEQFILSQEESEKMIYSYSVLVGRIFSKHLGKFKWMKDVLPNHIPHSQEKAMAEKSTFYPLPVIKKNEAVYEECADILDLCEDELSRLFTEAYGSSSLLDEKKVVIGGDQLTRVRLQGVKSLRDLAPDERRSFQHLSPVVCEMWHNKQDLLQKAYNTLWKKESQAEKGTLNFFKVLLRRPDVSGNVKLNFKAHWEFLISVGTFMILEQALEYFGMADFDSMPTKNQLPKDIEKETKVVQTATAMDILSKFVKQNHYAKFNLQVNNEKRFIVVGVNPDGKKIVVPYNEVFPPQKPDHLYNYCSNLCHWALHLMQLEDTAKEGNVDHLIMNCKYNLPFFFSYSTGSKYFIENIDFILKTQQLLSPQMKMRVLEGSFVNVKGGQSKNVEADLVQEHSVRNKKDFIRQLGSHNTEKAIIRLADAADAVSSITQKLDGVIEVKSSGARHAKSTSATDHKKIETCLRKTRPFLKTPGRQCAGFNTIEESPFHKINKVEMSEFIKRNIKKLASGQIIEDDLEEEGDKEENGDLDCLPELG